MQDYRAINDFCFQILYCEFSLDYCRFFHSYKVGFYPDRMGAVFKRLQPKTSFTLTPQDGMFPYFKCTITQYFQHKACYQKLFCVASFFKIKSSDEVQKGVVTCKCTFLNLTRLGKCCSKYRCATWTEEGALQNVH